MIVLDNPDIKNCEFGICSVLESNGKTHKMRVYKTIDKYIVLFGFGKTKDKMACNVSKMRQYLRESENYEPLYSFNYLN